jgi:hypothetical protein
MTEFLTNLRAAMIERAEMDKRHAALGLPTTTGGIGEAIVATVHPDWQRMPPGTEGYDFLDTERRRVQVKAWGYGSRRTFDSLKPDLCDRVIVIALGADDFTVVCDRLTEPVFAKETYRNKKGEVCFRRKDHVVEVFSAAA